MEGVGGRQSMKLTRLEKKSGFQQVLLGALTRIALGFRHPMLRQLSFLPTTHHVFKNQRC